MELEHTRLRLVGLNEVLSSGAQREQKHVQFFFQSSVDLVYVLGVTRGNVDVPIHGEPWHSSQPHGLTADE